MDCIDKKILDFFNEINFGVEDELDILNYRYFHSLRTAKLAQEIAQNEKRAHNFDMRTVSLLALFHDIGKNKKLVAENNLDLKDHDPNNIILFEKYVYPLVSDSDLIFHLRQVVEDFSYEKLNFLKVGWCVMPTIWMKSGF